MFYTFSVGVPLVSIRFFLLISFSPFTNYEKTTEKIKKIYKIHRVSSSYRKYMGNGMASPYNYIAKGIKPDI